MTDYRRRLEESNLPIELAVEIADALSRPNIGADMELLDEVARLVNGHLMFYK